MEHSRESARLGALRQLKLLDTPVSESFDRITRMAARLFDLPIAAVSLTDQDRQWFKSRIGVAHQTIPREGAPCAQVAETRGLVVINDLLADPAYADTPLARSGVRFYAGAPLVTREGFGLGAMCVLGVEPRAVTADEADSLKDLAAMVMAQIELQHAFGRIDVLTGLPNKHQFAEDLEDLTREDAGGTRLMVVVDLATAEQFDHLLRAKGSGFVDEHVRTSADMLTRLVGEPQVYHVATWHFAYLAPSDMSAQAYIDVLTSSLARASAKDVSRFVTTTSIGLSPVVLGQTDIADALRTAFSAAHDARATDARVGMYSLDLDHAHRRCRRLIDDFGAALNTNEMFELAYQPRIDLRTRRCVGAEALIRWRHAELGDISPGEFVPLIEQTELARPMTDWVLTGALRQAAHWRGLGLDLTISVNITASNLQQAGFAQRVVELTALSGLSTSHVELELTESAVMSDPARAMIQLDALAAAGFSLAIDDFGTGYSSLSYLQSLPAKVVKIDQSFIRDMAEDERRYGLVDSMIVLSQNLGYRVVAEGVEAPEIADLLRAAGCDEAQGFHYGRPMSADAFEAWLGIHADTQDRRSTAGPRRAESTREAHRLQGA